MTRRRALVGLLAAGLMGCWHASPLDSDAAVGADTDTDTDTDSDSDADADSDSDADADADADSDPDTESDTNPPPCPFACLPQTLCTLSGGIVHAEYPCGGGSVCCDTGVDDDTDTGADLTWVPFSGGTFQMGSDQWSGSQPVHEVTVPAFEMLGTEVTVAQYRACALASFCSNPGTFSNYCNWGIPGRDGHPVNCVSWPQAVDFCAWVGGRLPSEAEWEYAARSGGQDIDYPWGDEIATCDLAVMHGTTTYGYGCDTGYTWAACSKTAGNTEQGLCDLAGNVWEWVQDRWHENYDGAPADGSAWEESAGTSRVLRGGSFEQHALWLLSIGRYGGDESPVFQARSLGFRCAK